MHHTLTEQYTDNGKCQCCSGVLWYTTKYSVSVALYSDGIVHQYKTTLVLQLLILADRVQRILDGHESELETKGAPSRGDTPQ